MKFKLWLKRYAPPTDSIVRDGLPDFTFEADSREDADRVIAADYSAQIEESDFAYLEDEAGDVVRKWGDGNA